MAGRALRWFDANRFRLGTMILLLLVLYLVALVVEKQDELTDANAQLRELTEEQAQREEVLLVALDTLTDQVVALEAEPSVTADDIRLALASVASSVASSDGPERETTTTSTTTTTQPPRQPPPDEPPPPTTTTTTQPPPECDPVLGVVCR